MVIESLEPRRLLSANITNFHYDLSNDGANTNETILTPANVNTSSFGKVFSDTLDGQVYAEPLTVAGVTISNGSNTTTGSAGVHDVVFVATEAGSIYAIDAHSGSVLWYRTLANAANPTGDINNTFGASAVTAVTSNVLGVQDISPEYSITGTPVIDTANNVMYLVANTAEVINGVTHYVQRLHAISLSDGTDAVAPYMIGDTVIGVGNNTPIYSYGTGDGSITDPYNGTGQKVVQFNALTEAQRPGLSLVNNTVYVEWASHGDVGPYHGWVVAWNVSNLKSQGMVLSGVLDTSPNDGEAGIWSGGGGLSFEPDGSAFYFMTGNGTGGAPTLGSNGMPTDANYNEAVVKAVLDPTTTATNQGPNGWGMKVVDYFIPYNVAALDSADSDFGSGAPTLLPASAGIPNHPNLLVAAGKSGVIYVLDRNNLGHYQQFADAALNSVSNGAGQTTPPNAISGVLSSAAFYNGTLYEVAGYSGPMEAFVVNSNGILTETSQTTNSSFGYIPGSPVVSSDGSTDGIVWVLDRNSNELHAYAANSLSTELWNSAQATGGTDQLGASVKFGVPTVSNGEVFVATLSGLVAYGLKAPANAVPTAPVLATVTPLSNSSINLNWTDPTASPNTATAYLIDYSTDGINFTQVATAAAGATSIAIGGLAPATKYYFEVIGVNPKGNSIPSNSLSASTTSQTASISFPSGFTSGAGQLIQLNGSAAITNNSLVLVNNQQNEKGSAFYTTQQNITQFSTQFNFSLTGTWPLSNGMTFTIQNDLVTALGVGGQGLGYGNGSANGTGGIPNSVAIKFDVYNTSGTGSTGLYTNGQFPSGNAIELGPLGINLRSYDQMQVKMTYDGTTLAVTITDLTTKATTTHNYSVNIPQIIGSNNAWVGFTGGDGSQVSYQQIYNWSYTSGAGGSGGITASPNSPSGLGAVAATATSVNLNWTANSSNQTGYYLDRATDVNFTQNLLTQTITPSGPTYTDTGAGIAPGTTYYYRIRAFNSAGASGNSNVATVSIPVAPPKPTNQMVTNVTSNEIDISWQDNAGHQAQGYEILRATNHGTFSIIANLPPTSRTAPSPYTWSDTTVTPGNFYEYHILAYNSSGNNDFAGVNATTLTAAPTGLAAATGPGAINLSWNSTNGATGYNVYRGTVSGGPYTLIAPNVAATAYNDTGLANGTTYYYVVTGLDAGGESAQSAQFSAAPSSAVTTINFPNGFPTANNFTFNGNGHLIGSALALTNNFTSQNSSIFYNTAQNIQSFNTTFQFQINGTWPLGNGFTFVIQNAGLTALGQSGSGLGYGPASGTSGGIANSVAVKFDTYNSNGSGSTGLYTNGATPGGGAGSIDLTGSGFNLRSYNVITANFTYDGTTLTETLTDTVTGATVTEHYTVNIPQIVGGNTAFIGFTGADGSLTSNQNITNWTYTVVPSNNATIPATPTNLAASSGNTQVVLNWTASTGATSYTISYGTTNGSNYSTVLTGITGTSKTISGLTNGTQYYFVISAVNSAGASANSAQVSGTPAAVAPSAPTGIVATAGSTQVGLTWIASAGATSYTVSYGTTSGGPYPTVLSNITGTSTTVTGLTNGTPYYFIITATNTTGTSGNSAQATATPVGVTIPAAPGGLIATAGNGQVGLSWGASTGATSYTVSYGTTSGGPYPTVLTGISGTNTTITGLVSGQTYYFVVAAANSAGTGANSTQASAAPLTSGPNFANGFTGAGSSMTLNGNARFNGGSLLLTDGFSSEASSAYFNTLQNITGFSTTFQFQITGNWPLGNGFTFVIQNSALNALGGSGSGLGYSGITKSVAIKFDTYNSNGGGATGLYVNGAAPVGGAGSIDLTGTPFNMRSYDPSTAAITYDGTTLKVTFTDLVTKATVTESYAINIAQTIGSSMAYVGFTAGDGSLTSVQNIANWTFTSAPPTPQTPAVPSGFTASGGITQAVLNWTASTGATSYTISYGTTNGGPYPTVLTGISGTSTTITGLTNGTPYYFVISAVNASGASANSAQVTATPSSAPSIPATPTGLAPTAGANQVALSWNTSSGATSYTISYGTTNGSNYSTVVSGIIGTSTTITGLTGGTTYYFVVSATNASGTSANSAQVSSSPTVVATGPNYTNFTGATGLTMNGNAFLSNGNLMLTNGQNSQTSSVFYNTPQNISSFSTTFQFQITGNWPLGNGMTFVIQNSALNAIGQSGSGLGYGAANTGGSGGIPNSVAIKFDTYNSNGGGATGFYANGAAPVGGTGSIDLTGNFNLRSYNLITANISYDGTTLTEKLTDTVSGQTVTEKYTVNIPQLIGGSTAYVGFTAATGSLNSVQDVANWTFSSQQSSVQVPSAPTNLAATPGNGQAILSWAASTGATSYTVSYGATNGGPYPTVLTGITGTGTTITGLTNGTPYYFVVAAANSGGTSGTSAQATTTPALAALPAPTNLTATAGPGQAVLSWTAASGATSYTVSYGTTSGGPYPTTVTGLTGTGTTINGLTGGTTYYFIVTALNNSSSSAPSNQASTAPLALPNVPTGLSATVGNTQVALTWNSSPGATSYTISYGTTSGGPYPTVLTGITNTTDTVTGLTNGTTYYFVVSANNGAGSSANSTQTSSAPVAPITGPNFAGGFAGTNNLFTFNGSPRISGSSLLLTDGSLAQNGSVYFDTAQNISNFSTQFQFQTTGSWPLADGFTFIIQNAGLNAVGGSGGGLGYTGILNSVAIKFDIYDNAGEGTDSTGVYSNGAVPQQNNSIDLSASGFNLRSYDPSTCSLSYDGTTLTETLTDLITAATVTETYVINIPQLVGGNTAFVGFTASDGSITSVQNVSNWTFSSAAAASNPPAAPTNVAAAPGNNQVALSWSASTGATSYNVAYSTTSGGPYNNVLSGITGTSDTITGLNNGTQYYFVVTALNAAGPSSNSSQVSSTPVVPALAPPTNLAATGGAGQVSLTWTAAVGATSYTVSYGTTSGGPYATVISGITATNDTITGLNNGTPYYFVVSAQNSSGTSANSLPASAAPAANSETINYAAGFANSSSQFTFNGIGSARLHGSDLYILDDNHAEVASAWFNTPQNITNFSTTFEFQITGTWPLGNGFTFAIQNSGLNAIGVVGSGMGYGAAETGGTGGIPESVAIKFDVYNSQGEGLDSTGLYTDGAAPTNVGSIDLSSTGFNLRSYDNSTCTLTYDGTTLTEVLTDLVTGATATEKYTVNIPQIVGGNTAIIGFTGADYDITSNQVIHNWVYFSGPAPTAPTAPTGVTATAGNGQVALNWGSSANASSYTVSYGTVNGGPYPTVLTGINNTSDTITGLTNGVPYYFVVTAVNSVGASPNSTQATATPIAPPAAPTNFTASGGNGQAVLNWAASAGATSYTISYGTTQGGPYPTVLTGVTGTNDTITGLTNGTTYYFVVSAVDSAGAGANSTEANTTPVAVPNTPANLVATSGNGQVVLTWSASTGATSYTVSYGTTSGGPYPTVLTGITNPTDTITGLTNLTAYYFVVSAQNSTGTSVNSSQATATPAAPIPPVPTNVTPTSGNGQVTLNWTASTGATSYTIKYGTSTGVYSTTLTGITNPTDIITGLTNGTPYFFVVEAVNATGASNNSTEVASTPAAPLPGAPTNLAATPGNASANLTWTAVAGAISYTVSYGTSVGGPYPTVLTGITSASKAVTGLNNGTPYYFVVAAVNGTGTSGNSNEATTTPVAPTPNAPTGLQVSAGDGQVSLSWNTSSGATSYTVKYGTTTGGPYPTVLSGLTTTSKTITGLTDGTQYYFVVTATNTSGTSGNSTEATGTPSAPGTTINFAGGFAGATNLTSNGSAHLNGPQLVLLDNNQFETGSVFFNTAQNIASFSTQFKFQITGTWPIANGFTFVIQNTGLSALGTGGGGLGYASIGNSVAVKFDIFSSEGEGTDSTGVYTDGATPTITNSVDLSNTGFDLRSYDPSLCSLSYNGTVLTETLKDLISGATATEQYTINIPQVVGGSTAFVGFTAGDGSLISSEAVQNWTYASGTNAPATPTNLQGTGGGGNVNLTWNATPGAFTYNIKYGTTNGGPYPTVVSGILNTNTQVTGLTSGTTYYFIVTAVDAFGESVGSSQVIVTA
jgi:fibronectin type 3 domain-containing protein